jgi:hypothetical protein
LGYDQNFCFDLWPNLELRPVPAPAWRAHIWYHVQFTVSACGVCFFCRRDHANSSYQSMYGINKYRVTEKRCVLLMTSSSIHQALRSTRMAFVNFSLRPDTRVCGRNSGQCSASYN